MEKLSVSSKMLYAELGYQLQGIFYEVCNVLGPGFREETYRQAVIRELKRHALSFETEGYYDIGFKGENMIVIEPIWLSMIKLLSS